MLKIYKASAGSGKTYTLAYEYIKALLGVKVPESGRYCLNSAKYCKGYTELSNRHKYILAITFTNKATEEMKHRIIEKLDALSVIPAQGQKDADYAEKLCDEFGCSRAELSEVAAKSLRQLLNFYSAFNVTTIDSFFQRVLRTFARELDRQGDFSIELNDKLAVQVAVNAMLDDFNREGEINTPLGRWIVSYISTQFNSGEKTNFFNRRSKLHTTLVALLSNISEETFKVHEEAMQQYLSVDEKKDGNPHNVEALLKALARKKADIIVEVKDMVAADLSALEASGVTLDQLNGRLSIRKYITDYFLTGRPCDPRMIDNSTLVAVADGEDKAFTKAFRGTEADKAAFADMLRRVRSKYYDYFGMQCIEDAVGTFALLTFAWRYLKDFSTTNNTVLLSDTGNMLSRIIGQNETPFIYERMGVNLRNFLIDEFQDTSRMQWSNLMPLVRNGLGEGHDSLIIGDEKQSIYRFRNSDSSLLHTEVENVDFPAGVYGTTVHGTGTEENTNWRSASDIVLFNNTLFTNMSRALDVDGFENVCQAVSPRNVHHRGLVEFVPVKDEAADEAFKTDAEFTSDDRRKLYALDLMAARMMRQHDELGYSWRDMAVLVNTNQEGALVVERLMTAYPSISVMSEESLYVKRSPAVQLIIGVLKLMNVPDTGEVSHTGYPTPAQLARIMSRLEYFRNMGLSVDEAIDKAKLTDASDGLSVGIDAIKKSKPSSLSALVETIIREQLSASDRRTQVAYLTAFLDYVTDYCSKANPTLKAFLDNWEVAKDRLSVSSASDIDAVKVMTIHKSKGLEFDCVHIPFGSWDLIGKPRGQWIPFPDIPGVDKALCPPVFFIEMSKWFSMPESMLYDRYCRYLKETIEDTMNKTYVAYTRASEQLIVYYNNGRGIGSNIADAMMAGYDGDDKWLADISRYYGEDGAFVMGESLPKVQVKPSSKEATPPDDRTGMHLDEYVVTNNEEAQVITRVSDVLDFTPDPGDDSVFEDSDEDCEEDVYVDETARLRGVMLHDVLSRIITLDDIDRAVTSYSAQFGLTVAEKQELMMTMTHMLDCAYPHLRRWFADNARAVNEQAVYDPDRGIMKRIDRLVFLPDGSVEVIDYKFTVEPTRTHHRQVQGYMRMLRRMGYRDVRGYLWYPFRGEIIEVKPTR